MERACEVAVALSAELAPDRDLSHVGPDSHLEQDLGLGSLERAELLRRLEVELGRTLSEQSVFQARTLEDLVRATHGLAPLASPEPHLRPAGQAPPLPDRAVTLLEALAYQAERQTRPFLYLWTEGRAFPPMTFGQLQDESERYAAGLAARGVGPGQRVALMLPTGIPFLAAYFGILRRGAVPVPLYPPFRMDQLEEFLRRQRAILENAEASLLVTFERARAVADLIYRGRVAGDEELPLPETCPPVPLTGREPALIQYTSGSTGQPKGVLLSHANLLANLRSYGRGMAIGPEDVCVSWLPLYHDMGLIGSLLGSLYHGIPLALMGPQDFLARPSRWLRAISQYGGTISPAPNFAYEICARRIPDAELEGLDLSTWRIALNGAEAVRPDTVERFCRRLAPCGFRPGAMFPAYGLAEASLGVTFPPPGRGMKVDRVARLPLERDGVARAPAPEEEALEQVSCGSALPDMEVRIAGMGERRVGPVQFRGPSSLERYYGHGESAQDPDGWVDTGDLGYLADGELYIVGRSKDLILKAGRNLHPEDVEDLAAEVEGVRRGCVAAFGVHDPESGTESLVILAETRLTGPAGLRDLAEAIRRKVAEGVGLPPDRVELGPPGSVLKTPSGKIRRAECRQRVLSGAVGRRSRPGLRLVL
ncbi:MAG: AMP-binding protein, partial [Candidatus Eremiobacterota bacterium]